MGRFTESAKGAGRARMLYFARFTECPFVDRAYFQGAPQFIESCNGLNDKAHRQDADPSIPAEFTRKANSGSPFLLPAAVTSGVSY
jgi:hypothetical protein